MAKPEPPTAMAADRGPKFGVRVTTRGITFSVALAETPPAPSSFTVIVSLSPTNSGLRTNCAAAVNKKAASTQPTTTIEPPVTDGGTAADDMVHIPAVAKLLPVTLTVAPSRAGLGDNVCEICGTTVNDTVNASPVLPASLRVLTSAPLFARATVNEPVAIPADIVQVGGGTAAIVFPSAPPVCVSEQVVSPKLNPLALKLIALSPLPLLGVNVSVSTVTVNDADTVVWGTCAALVIPNVCTPATAPLLTTKVPVSTPTPSMLQTPGGNPVLRGAGTSLMTAQAKGPGR